MKINDLLDPLKLQELLERKFSRKSFVKFLGVSAAFLLLETRSARNAFAKATGQSLKPRPAKKVKTECDLAVAKGENPSAITMKAVEMLGGMTRFVRSGDIVVVKPNIGWDRTPDLAGCTNPDVVAALVTMAKESGAKVVKVFDYPCNDPKRTYVSSGIEAAVKKAGGSIYYCDEWKYYPAKYPQGALMGDWPVFRDAVECDCFINVPVAKNHGLTELTLSMKNLMGVCGGRRGSIHWNIDKKLAEVTEFIKPNLTVIDAYRILLRNGPTGGDPDDVAKKNTVIASADPVLADAYATTLFELNPSDIGYIVEGARRGLGSMDIDKANIRSVEI